MMAISQRGPGRKFQIEVYNGQEWRGTIAIQGREYRALGINGKLIGKFSDQRSAARAVIYDWPEKDFCGKPPPPDLERKRG
jgi:hypothetical protein